MMTWNMTTIASNRKARHDYSLHEHFDAGMVLRGWEVKSLRDSRLQLKESYVIIKNEEVWLIGAHISPLSTTSTHVEANPRRDRKLLLHRKQINKLIGATQQKGFTLVPLRAYWTRNKVKCEFALAKGKKQHDKRASIKERDWNKNKARILKQNSQ
jgi:SsrA-binding protein